MRFQELSPDRRALLERADYHLARMLEANSAQPYVHADYERELSLARASLTLACDGDVRLAYALEYCFHDSNEELAYYLTKWDSEELVRDHTRDELMKVQFVVLD